MTKSEIDVICRNISQRPLKLIIYGLLLILASSSACIRYCDESTTEFFTTTHGTVYIYAISEILPSGEHYTEYNQKIFIDDVEKSGTDGSVIIEYESVVIDIGYGKEFYLNNVDGTFSDKDMKEKGVSFTLFPKDGKVGSKWSDDYNDYEIKDKYKTYFKETPYTITLLLIKPKNNQKTHYLHYNFKLGVYKYIVIDGDERLERILIDKYIQP